MPVTFATYAIGMMALSGVPIFFSGFWSKDAILHAAHSWSISRWPFYLGVFGAFLTAFYMTRQVFYVFFGNCRLQLGRTTGSEQQTVAHAGSPSAEHPRSELPPGPHESPGIMTAPLTVLAAFSIVLGFIGTPAWPWFQDFLLGHTPRAEIGKLFESEVLGLMLLSSAVVFIGLGFGWWLYGRRPVPAPDEPDVLERLRPDLWTLLRRKYYVDEIYEHSVIWLNSWWARTCDWLDQWIWNGAIQLIAYVVVVLSWFNRFFYDFVVNFRLYDSCRRLS